MFMQIFNYCPIYWPDTSLLIIPLDSVKLAKIWALLENLAHIERQYVFAIETLRNYIQLEGSQSFELFMYF